MIVEVAEITIKPVDEAAFEESVAKAAPLFLRARGCHGLELRRVIEHPNVYLLMVKWETVENHMVDFRSSADFQEWRRLTGAFFAGPPMVTHSKLIANF
jgi:quinol monooxygenase YgiN